MKMRTTLLPVCAHVIGEEEIDEVVDTLRSESLTTGPKVKRFERAFAEFIGTQDALALSSCTAALHVGLVVLGVGPGDEVITTPMTFPATVNVIEHVGARPVLVDIEPDTMNIDSRKITEAITPRTKALIPVHYGGHPCDMNRIMALAEENGLFVLEDAAHAVMAWYRGKRIGTIGHLTAFSFYASKNMTTIEGGALTGKAELLERARVISRHGMKATWDLTSPSVALSYEIVFPGFKYNMTDVQAAIGLHQLNKLPALQQRRQNIARQYQQAFANTSSLEVPTIREDVEHGWYLYVLRLQLNRLTIERDRFVQELKVRNIGSGIYYKPIHMHPYYRDKYGYRPEDFPVALEQYKRVLALPLSARMSDEDCRNVIDAVLDVVAMFRA